MSSTWFLLSRLSKRNFVRISHCSHHCSTGYADTFHPPFRIGCSVDWLSRLLCWLTVPAALLIDYPGCSVDWLSRLLCWLTVPAALLIDCPGCSVDWLSRLLCWLTIQAALLIDYPGCSVDWLSRLLCWLTVPAALLIDCPGCSVDWLSRLLCWLTVPAALHVSFMSKLWLFAILLLNISTKHCQNRTSSDIILKCPSLCDGNMDVDNVRSFGYEYVCECRQVAALLNLFIRSLYPTKMPPLQEIERA